MKPTLILDFDGTLHSYISGWKRTDCIPDPPTDGAAEAVAELRQTYHVVVVSSRCVTESGIKAVWQWLHDNRIIVDDVRADKPAHVLVIDDRALHFEGDWKATLRAVKAATIPWNKREGLSLCQALDWCRAHDATLDFRGGQVHVRVYPHGGNGATIEEAVVSLMRNVK